MHEMGVEPMLPTVALPSELSPLRERRDRTFDLQGNWRNMPGCQQDTGSYYSCTAGSFETPAIGDIPSFPCGMILDHRKKIRLMHELYQNDTSRSKSGQRICSLEDWVYVFRCRHVAIIFRTPIYPDAPHNYSFRSS